MKCYSRKYVSRSFTALASLFVVFKLQLKVFCIHALLKGESASKFLMDQSFRAEFKRFQLYWVFCFYT